MLIKEQSKINEIGIFSNYKIEKSKEVCKINGEIINYPKEHCAYIGEGKWIDDPVLNFINHSCDANCLFDINNLTIVALRDISQDEEITLDYNKTEQGDKKILCNCGSKNCKGFFFIKN